MAEETKPRAIIHLDMDCFYAAIEVRDNPKLRGKPVGVGGMRDRRGVLTTCNYEARKFGVHSAMPTFMALQRCPQLIMVSPRFDVYRRESTVIREILHRFTPLVEPLSLDEAYLDVSDHAGEPGPLAQIIRDLIFQKTKLTASAGIGPNKLIAKIASDINKPNGQCEVALEDVPDFMAELPVRKLWGIGAVTEQKLDSLGIHTCAEMQRFSRVQLTEHFGKFGLELYDQCRGIDHRPVEPHRERKSLSTEETFSRDLETLEQCEEELRALFEDLAAELAQKTHDRPITKIFVKLKFNDFTRTTVERAGLSVALEDFMTLLHEGFARTGKPVRLLGVGVRFAEIEQNRNGATRITLMEPNLFSPLQLRDVRLCNRIGVSPMCEYSSEDGFATDWHLVHLGSRAVGGAALVMTEATAVTADGRISPQDLGIWKDEHIEMLARIFRFIEAQGAVAGMQLAHAGRKASTAPPWDSRNGLSEAEGGWRPIHAPTAEAFAPDYVVPKEITREEIQEVVRAFAAAAQRALTAGARVIELHAAHGYLIHEFLSPLSNKLGDEYGGSFENRIRILREVVDATRKVWPEKFPLFVRISATDWVDGGWTPDDSVELAKILHSLGVDLIDCSSGGVVPKANIPVGPGYQVPFAEKIRREANIATAAVGLITEAAQANEIIASGQADMVFLARQLLREPYWPLHAALKLGVKLEPPVQYGRAFIRS